MMKYVKINLDLDIDLVAGHDLASSIPDFYALIIRKRLTVTSCILSWNEHPYV